MKLHLMHHSAPEPTPTEAPGYQARHLRDVPVDTDSETGISGGSHVRPGFGVLSRLARADGANA